MDDNEDYGKFENEEIDYFVSKRAKRREEAKKRKQNRLKMAILFILIVGISFFVVYMFSGIEFNIQEEIAKISTTEEISSAKENLSIPIETIAKVDFIGLDESFLYVTKDGVKALDFKNNQIWNNTYTMNTPITVNDGEVTAVLELNGKTVIVYNEDGEQYNIKTDGSVLQLAVNKSGSLGVIVESAIGYKIQVYNETGLLIMERIDQDSGIYPIGIEVSEDGKILMVSYMDTTGVSLGSKILFFYTNKEDAKNTDSGDFYASIAKKEMFIPVVKQMNSGNFVLIGDSQMFCVDAYGNEVWTVEFTNEIENVKFGKDMFTVISFGKELDNKDGFDNGTVVIYDESAKEYAVVETGSTVTYMEAYEYGVVIGNNKEFICTDYKGTTLWSHIATQDINDIIPLSSATTVLYVTNVSAEIKEMK